MIVRNYFFQISRSVHSVRGHVRSATPSALTWEVMRTHFMLSWMRVSPPWPCWDEGTPTVFLSRRYGLSLLVSSWESLQWAYSQWYYGDAAPTLGWAGLKEKKIVIYCTIGTLTTPSSSPPPPPNKKLQEYLEFKQWQESKKEEPAMVRERGTIIIVKVVIISLCYYTDQGQPIVCWSKLQCLQSTIPHPSQAN